MIPSILSNFQFMCCLFSSSPKKLPQKNKSKHHHHHKIIQIKHKIQNLQNIQNQKTERTQPWKEAVQIRFENTMPFEAIGSWISYSLVKSQEATGREKPTVAEFPGEKTWCQPYCWWKKSGVNQLRWLVVYPHYLQGFMHSRWCRISEPSAVSHRSLMGLV